MSQVFRVALPGGDVNRGKVTEMAVDVRYPSPKIDTKPIPNHAGIIYVNWRSTLALAKGTIRLIDSFPHGYNHVPTVFASYKADNGSNVTRGILPFQYGALGIIVVDADAKNINLKYYSFDAGIPATNIPPFTMQVRYYVMAEHGVTP
jgi:hypothetical protein